MPPQLRVDPAFDLEAVVRRSRDVDWLREWIRKHLPELAGPTITGFAPASGPRGTVVTISGSGFSTDRLANQATVGGTPAVVLSASATERRST